MDGKPAAPPCSPKETSRLLDDNEQSAEHLKSPHASPSAPSPVGIVSAKLASPQCSGSVRVALAVLISILWMAVSSLLILLNKYIMVSLHFKYPITVSSMGMLASGLLSFLCCRVLGLVEAKNTVTLDFFAARMLPVGLFMALTLWTGNEVYLHLTVAFIQMLKAFVPVITMIALFIARMEDPSSNIIASVLLITCGTAIAAYGEVKLSLIGLAYMLCSEIGEAIRLVMTQYLLVDLKFHPIEGLMYLSPACCVWLIAGAAAREWPHLWAHGGLAILGTHPLLFLLAAVLGFAVNALAYMTIKLASSLTLKVLATVKNTLLVAIGLSLLGETVTAVQSIGYFVSLIGFGWYNQIKMSKMAVTSDEAGSETSETVVKTAQSA